MENKITELGFTKEKGKAFKKVYDNFVATLVYYEEVNAFDLSVYRLSETRYDAVTLKEEISFDDVKIFDNLFND